MVLKTLADLFKTVGDGSRGALDGDQVRTATAALLFHAIAIDGVADENANASTRCCVAISA